MHMRETRPSWLYTPTTLADTLRRTTLTKWQIMQAMYGDGSITINGKLCTLSSVQREDGSGNSFNLEVYCEGTKYKVYARADS
jgi:hypothetical protein